MLSALKILIKILNAMEDKKLDIQNTSYQDSMLLSSNIDLNLCLHGSLK